MSSTLLGVCGTCVLLIMIFLKMPVGFAMALIGALGMYIIAGAASAFSLIANEPFSVASNYIYCAIPLFVFMGCVGSNTRMSADAFFTLNKWIGQLPGGLAMGAVGVCTIFAAMCADPISTAATITKASLGEMRRYKYSDRLSLGTIAAAGNLGFLIPPSLVMIIYGILTEQSIGALFMAGVLPGLLISASFMATIYILCKRNPKLALQGPKIRWMDRLKATPRLIPVLIIVALVMGGIYAGVFTPTEAAAWGVFTILLISVITRQLSWKDYKAALSETSVITGMIFMLIIGAMIFSRFLVICEVPSSLANFIGSLEVPRLFILITVLVTYTLLGCIMDLMSILIVAVPILHPLLVELGFNPLWLAVLTVITVLIGNVTPPVGIVVFALSGMVKDAQLFTIFRGVVPFIFTMLICLAILIAFPQISIWLPSMMQPGY